MHFFDAGIKRLPQLPFVSPRIFSTSSLKQNFRKEAPWSLRIEQAPSRNRLQSRLQRSKEHLIADFEANLRQVPDALNLASSEGEVFVKSLVESLQTALVPGYSLQQYVERLPKSIAPPSSQHLNIYYSISFSTPEQSSLRHARVYLESKSLQFDSRWLLGSPDQSKGVPFYVDFRTKYVTNSLEPNQSPSNISSDKDLSKPRRITQDSVDSLDQVHPALGLHARLRDSLKINLDSIDFGKELSSICSTAFNPARTLPYGSFLDQIEVQISVQRTKQLKLSTELSLNSMEHQQVESKAFEPEKLLADRVYIALGSNVGNCVENIELACKEMNKQGIIVTKTSFLYKTQPMYFENQQPFINGVCEANTSLSPLELLKKLKTIETDLGRKKSMENGPRTIDLDILLYHEKIFDSDTLSIPHQKIMEREFVLRPLCDLIPKSKLPCLDNSYPKSPTTFEKQLRSVESSSTPLSPMTPLSPSQPPLTSRSSTRSTSLMAILNLTPDSFSDGGLHNFKDPVSIVRLLCKDLDSMNGPSIIDVGGQSTRPHAPQISAEEELSRILPTITAIRSDPSLAGIAVSVDTYRATVASAAVEAGANIVNDVSAGLLDPQMLSTIARLGCTCILMHMRGSPDNMNQLTDYPDGIIQGVGREILLRVQEAEKAGIRRWRICLDPGIGFAKNQEQNLELLRRFNELRDFEGLRGFPWVVGASRKGFVGNITGVQKASERQFGTATAVAAAVQGGADIVRVHDLKEMAEVVKMADAIWRSDISKSMT